MSYGMTSTRTPTRVLVVMTAAVLVCSEGARLDLELRINRTYRDTQRHSSQPNMYESKDNIPGHRQEVQKEGRLQHLDILMKSGDVEAAIETSHTKISINSSFPFYDEGSDNQNTGFLITVLHQITGEELTDPVHIQPWADLSSIVEFIDSIQLGRFIVFTMRGKLDYQIPSSVVQYLNGLGSTVALTLNSAMSWSWLFIKGGRTLLEITSTRGDPSLQYTVSTHSTIALAHDNAGLTCSSWPLTSHWDMRRKLCNNYEGYGRLCHCEAPLNINNTHYKTSSLYSHLRDAVIVMIGGRATSLYRSLSAVLSYNGGDRSNLVLYTMKITEELKILMKIFQVKMRYLNIKEESQSVAISRLYTRAITDITSHLFTTVKYIIFVEDDVLVSPDFFKFMNYSASLLDSDPTLYCASAHNDNSFPSSASDYKAMLRTESYPNYGWMTTTETAQDMVKLLKGITQDHDWDMMMHRIVRGSRECIIPEISRSHHFSRDGSHISQLDVRLSHAAMIYNKEHKHLLTSSDFSKLQSDAYEDHLRSLFKKATALEGDSVDICDGSLWENTRSRGDVVMMFVQGGDDPEYSSSMWRILAMCLGLYPFDPREVHRGMIRTRSPQGSILLVINYPISQYSKWKPPNTTLFEVTEGRLAQANTKLLNLSV